MLKFQTKVILSVAFGFKLDCLNKTEFDCSKGQRLIRFSFLQLSDFVVGSLSHKLRNVMNVKINDFGLLEITIIRMQHKSFLFLRFKTYHGKG